MPQATDQHGQHQVDVGLNRVANNGVELTQQKQQ
jgi:hypothetical protein